jgi:hypothetical protein
MATTLPTVLCVVGSMGATSEGSYVAALPVSLGAVPADLLARMMVPAEEAVGTAAAPGCTTDDEAA